MPVLFRDLRPYPITLAVVPPTLLAVVLLATYLPARRAARLDPMGVLRND